MMDLITQYLIPLLAAITMTIAVLKDVLSTARKRKWLRRKAMSNTDQSTTPDQAQAILNRRNLIRAFGLFSALAAIAWLAMLTYSSAGAEPVTVGRLASMFQALILAISGMMLIRDI